MTSSRVTASSFELVPHPKHAPRAVRAVSVEALPGDAGWMRLRWRVEGARALVVPALAGDHARADGLWQTTCFEAFVQPEGARSYVEVNLSPSGRWNVYDFTDRREGMAPRPCAPAPTATMQRTADGVVVFEASLPRPSLPDGPCRIGLTAVIEEQGGVRSWWALAHGSIDAPDFHDPATFLARIDPSISP